MKELKKKLLELDGVVGVGKGSIVIYVEDEKYVDAVPKYINGKPVKVMVVGKVSFCSRRSRVRPVFGGISIGSTLIDDAGTLGVVDSNGYIVTCTHVVGFKNLDGDFIDKRVEVIQPGRYDGGNDNDVIGVVTKINKWKWNDVDSVCYADVALCKCEVSSYRLKVLGDNSLYDIDGWCDVSVGDVVRKSGRTSGVTFHRVVDTHAMLKVHLGNKFAVFDDVVVVFPPILPGDSGSIFDKDGKVAGVGFAGSKKIGAFIKSKYAVSMGADFGEKDESVGGGKALLAVGSLYLLAGGLYAVAQRPVKA